MLQTHICLIAQSIFPISDSAQSRILFTQCRALIDAGHKVTVLFTDQQIIKTAGFSNWVRFYAESEIELIGLSEYPKPIEGSAFRKHSFNVYQWLKSKNFDHVFFEVNQGCAFYSLMAQKFGLHFRDTSLYIYGFEPADYLRQKLKIIPHLISDLELDYLEQKTLEMADEVITFDSKIKEWLDKNKWLTKHISIIESHECPPLIAKTPIENKVNNYQVPFISICIPHYERPLLLKQLLESLQKQTLKNFEVIVVDDGSSKAENIKRLKELEVTHLPLVNGRLIYSTNQGPSNARNLAARNAKGEYILFMDDDNIADHRELEIFSQATKSADAEILTCFFQRFCLTHKPSSNSESNSVFLPLGGVPHLGLFENIFGDMNCLIRREIFFKLGGLQGGIDSIWEDWEFFSRASLAGIKIEVIPEILFWYRDQNISQLKKKTSYESFYERSQPYMDLLPSTLKKLVPIISQREITENKITIHSEIKEDQFLIPLFQLSLSPGCIQQPFDIIETRFEKNGMTLVTKADDPNFLFTFSPFEEIKKVIIQIEITASEKSCLELFYKTENDVGFLQQNTILEPITKGWNLKHLYLNTPQLTGEFRLDIGTIAATYTIHSLKIYTYSSIKEIVSMKRKIHALESSNEDQLPTESTHPTIHFNNLLLKLSVLFEKPKWSNVNIFFKKLYSTFFTSFFQKLLSLRFSDKIIINSRHSSVHGSRFNLFLSDLDWDIVLPESKLTSAPKIANWLTSSKKFFPFIGEQEYYLKSELELKEELINKIEPIYSTLRTIRKITWMENSYNESPTAYHRYKSLRAIQICFDKLDIEEAAKPDTNHVVVSEWLENYILSSYSSIEINSAALIELNDCSVFSHYFGSNIRFSSHRASELEYSLSPKAALILLSIVPDNNFKNLKINNAVKDLRNNNPQIKMLSEQLKKIEFLITQSAARSHNETPQWAKDALNYLKESENI